MQGYCRGVGSGGGRPSIQAGPGDLARYVFGLEFFDLGMIKRPFSGHFQNGVICLPTQNTEGSPEWRAWRRGAVDGHDHRRCRSWTSPPLPYTSPVFNHPQWLLLRFHKTNKHTNKTKQGTLQIGKIRGKKLQHTEEHKKYTGQKEHGRITGG